MADDAAYLLAAAALGVAGITAFVLVARSERRRVLDDVLRRGGQVLSIRQRFFWLAMTEVGTRRWKVTFVERSGRTTTATAQTTTLRGMRWLDGPFAAS